MKKDITCSVSEICVKVVPGAKKEQIRREDKVWKIYLTAPAVDGKANKALIRFLAGYFNVSKTQIEIIKGLKSRHKTISIMKFKS